MKIVFSRKGLDSSFGNYASPILPDGQLCWVPIPEDSRNKPGLPKYEEIQFDKTSLGDIMNSITDGKFGLNRTAHLDPDIIFSHRNRPDGWMPIFGQTGAAERHLRNQGVDIGDIFLFFAWFKQCTYIDGKLRYDKTAPDIHALYGWMQIENKYTIDGFFRAPSWADSHPHMLGEKYGPLDVLYSSPKNLAIGGKETSFPGAGAFRHINERLVLTAPGESRSNWLLPGWMYPDKDKRPLSYNEKLEKWELTGSYTKLRVASRGQEFVLDCHDYPETNDWLYDILSNSSLI